MLNDLHGIFAIFFQTNYSINSLYSNASSIEYVIPLEIILFLMVKTFCP